MPDLVSLMEPGRGHHIYALLISEERYKASSMVRCLDEARLKWSHNRAGRLIGVILNIVSGDKELHDSILRRSHCIFKILPPLSSVVDVLLHTFRLVLLLQNQLLLNQVFMQKSLAHFRLRQEVEMQLQHPHLSLGTCSV